MAKRLRNDRQANAKVVLGGFQLIKRIESEDHGREGIDEIPCGNTGPQHVGQLASPSPIGNGQSIKRKHAERSRMVERPRLLVAVDGVLEPTQAPKRIAPDVER